MAQPYVGEIRMFAGDYAPAGWYFCDGSPLPISEYETLFNLIGTTYGGDGESTFAVPDLRGRIPVHRGGGYALGESGGVEEVTLTVQQLPGHGHTLTTSDAPASSRRPEGAVPARAAGALYRTAPSSTQTLAPQAMGPSGGGNQPHTNLQPYLCVHFIISLFGIFPSPT